jgi:predicted permease
MLELWRRLRYALRRRQMEADIAAEIELHRAMTQARFERNGLSPEDASRASLRRMGNVALAREDANDAWIFPWLRSLRQDAGYALRGMRRQPGVTAIVVGTLAAGMGLNTTVFSVFNGLAMRPWPAREPDRIVTIYNLSRHDIRTRGGGGPMGFSLAEVQYFRHRAKSFSDFMATRSGGGNQVLDEDDAAVSWVSGNYFDLLGVVMTAGRGFMADEDRTGSPIGVAVISHGYWQRRFGGDPAVAGKTVQFEDVPFTIVGIAPPAFIGTSPRRTDVWMPIASAVLLRPEDRWVRNVAGRPENCCLAVAGRLAPGVTREQARAELVLLDQQFRAGRDPDAGAIRIDGTQLTAGPRGDVGSTFVPLFAAVMMVLVLACANVGNLLIARSAARRREIAVRLSLGASRGRIVRQLLTESLSLALVSGVVGMLFAAWFAPFLLAEIGGPSTIRSEPDTLVLTYAVGLSLLSCLLFGLAPALHGTRASVASALKGNGIQTAAGVPLRNLFLALQVAVTVVLLVSAGLLARAVQEATTRDTGFSMENLSVVSFDLPARGYDTKRLRATTFALADAVERAAPASKIALTSAEPLGTGNIKGNFAVTGIAEEQFNSVYEVSPSYFNLLGLGPLVGRTLQASDANTDAIVINETMARRYWTHVASAVGQRILVDPASGGSNTPGHREIVGVVRDVLQTGLASADPTIYQPLSGRILPRVLIRSSTGHEANAIVAAAKRVDAKLRARTRPVADNLGPIVRSSRTGAIVAASLGMLALVLAAVGILGLFSYWVQQRTREIGIHMALGARPSRIVRLLVASSGTALVSGLALGIVAAFAASGLLRSYLFGVNRADPIAYVAPMVLLTVAAIVATWLPARRATRIDPVIALRVD